MSAKALEDLEAITDLLGPGLWLQVDEATLERYFGITDPVAGATAFAKKNGCVFLPGRRGRDGRFGRAYFKVAASGRTAKSAPAAPTGSPDPSST
jgi:hypothetical protein